MTLKKEISENPDEVMKDGNKLKVVISDPELAIKLLKSKGVYSLTINIDGEDIELVRPTIPVPPF